MQNKENVTIDKIIDKMKINNPNSNIELIKKAYDYAYENHKEQKRISGEPYIIHPLEVAYILAELELDDSTICAALLHDVVEDTDYTLDDIKERFGVVVANLVDGVEDTPITHEDIVREFGNEIAEMVEGVTKLRKNPIYNSRRTASRRL